MRWSSGANLAARFKFSPPLYTRARVLEITKIVQMHGLVIRIVQRDFKRLTRQVQTDPCGHRRHQERGALRQLGIQRNRGGPVQ